MHSPGSVAFRIFGLDVMWYGLLIGGGFLLATIISYLRAPKHQIKSDFILDLVIWMIPAAIVGARAYYVIFSWSDYAGDWKKILDIRSGGLAIHGGLILCFLVGYFVCKHYKQGFVRTADLVAVSIPLAQAIGADHRRCWLPPDLPVRIDLVLLPVLVPALVRRPQAQL